jgi:hypothetical protein
MTDDLVQRLREAQCPDNMGCNPLAKYCQCVPMDEAAERIEALCRAIERHEAYKQEVSDAVEIALLDAEDTATIRNNFSQFIIIKPDPLVDALKEADSQSPCSDEQFAEAIRAALDAFGFEIREKGQ